jgi:hypothetical protein
MSCVGQALMPYASQMRRSLSIAIGHGNADARASRATFERENVDENDSAPSALERGLPAKQGSGEIQRPQRDGFAAATEPIAAGLTSSPARKALRFKADYGFGEAWVIEWLIASCDMAPWFVAAPF